MCCSLSPVGPSGLVRQYCSKFSFGTHPFTCQWDVLLSWNEGVPVLQDEWQDDIFRETTTTAYQILTYTYSPCVIVFLYHIILRCTYFFFLYKAFSVLYVITIQSQGLISNFILSQIINLTLNTRVHPLESLCFCYNNMYTLLLCTCTSTVSALTLILTLALSLLLH